jgi:hypothetical protein
VIRVIQLAWLAIWDNTEWADPNSPVFIVFQLPAPTHMATLLDLDRAFLSKHRETSRIYEKYHYLEGSDFRKIYCAFTASVMAYLELGISWDKDGRRSVSTSHAGYELFWSMKSITAGDARDSLTRYFLNSPED